MPGTPQTDPPRPEKRRDNVLLIHWHDLGRFLGAYGHDDVRSPVIDALAAESVLLTQAHATAPLCSPSRGSLLTGRHPHDNGLIGLAHHGWHYRDDVVTLPQQLSDAGWLTALYGMQHESSDPSTLGYDSYDVTDSACDHVVTQAQAFLDAIGDRPFLLNAGFFETHRPYPAEDYVPADPATVRVPDTLPDTPEVRADLAAFHGSITKADAAVGRLLSTLDENGLAESTWVVFHTDHGAALPRAKSTLYDGGTGIALVIRPPRGRGHAPQRYDALFSGVDLVPTLLDVLGVEAPEAVQGVSHAPQLFGDTDDATPARERVFTQKTYHDSYDPIRAVRTQTHAYIENLTDRPLLDLPLDILDSPSGASVRDRYTAPRPRRELYDLRTDPEQLTNLAEDPEHAAIRDELADVLATWRRETHDELPSDEEGTRIAHRNMAEYLSRHPQSPTKVQRSPRAQDRGIEPTRGRR